MGYKSFKSLCTLGMIPGAGAFAGGYIAPTVEPVVAAPVVQATPVSDWAGGYAGGSLGYVFGADDKISLDLYSGGSLVERNTDLGSVDVNGPTVSLHAGYRWQRGNWVFGPELWVEGSSADATDTVALGGSVEVESAVNHVMGLQVKTGRAVDPQTLVYGTAGAVYGDFDYTLADALGSETANYDATGYSLGLGVERKIRDNLLVFAEWQYRNFGTTEVEFGDDAATVLTRATPEHHHVKLGVNFAF